MMFKRSAMMVVAGAVLAGLAGCQATGKSCTQTCAKEAPMKYVVQRTSEPVTIDANWDKPVWQKVQPLELTCFMGEKPEHMPKTQAKLLYDDKNVYVIFRVEDQYIRAVADKYQGMVCRDSCAEFFFAPWTDVKKGYFNLEMNCGGSMLLNFQVIPRSPERVPVAWEDAERIEVAHTMPRIVEPEITDARVWVIEYRMPTDFLAKYAKGAVMPAPGVVWRANFFKCADQTSKPHWLTWSFIDRPKPDFHVPEYFGTLTFE